MLLIIIAITALSLLILARAKKRCPNCAEKIQSAATICRFCQTPQTSPKGGPSNKLVVIGLGALVALALLARFINVPKSAPAEQASPSAQPIPAKWRFASNDRAAILAEVERRIAAATPESTAMALVLLKEKFGGDAILFDAKLRPIRDRAKRANDSAVASINAPQIESLRHQEQQLGRSDIVGRLAIWQKISSLAPGDESYRQTADDLYTQVDAPRAAAAQEQYYRDNPEKAVIVSHKWSKGGFGMVMLADFTLKNKSNLTLKDFQIECELSGPSGTLVTTKHITLFEKLAPLATRTIRDVNVGFINSQSARAGCYAIGAEVG